jgi:hypothetical protein
MEVTPHACMVPCTWWAGASSWPSSSDTESESESLDWLVLFKVGLMVQHLHHLQHLVTASHTPTWLVVRGESHILAQLPRRKILYFLFLFPYFIITSIILYFFYHISSSTIIIILLFFCLFLVYCTLYFFFYPILPYIFFIFFPFT